MSMLTDELKYQLNDLIRSVDGVVAVYYQHYQSGYVFAINEQVSFNTASLMKVIVGLQFVQLIEQGKLSNSQTILLHNSFRSKHDQSTYSLSSTIDSDPELYKCIGSQIAIVELLRRMITRSSNLATNNLFELIEPYGELSQLLASLNMKHTQVVRGVEDQKAYDAGLINYCTAADMSALLSYIHAQLTVQNQGVMQLHRILCEQEHNDIIPALLPSHVTIAHKTGTLQASLHDAALITTSNQQSYSLVILSQQLANKAHAQSVFAQISELLYHCSVR